MEHPLKAWRMAQFPRKTLIELAETVGVTASHISEIENWKNKPSLDLMIRLCVATGLKMDAFVIPRRINRKKAAV